MEINKQSQNAGDNSQQIQAGTVIIQNGITEQRAREISLEVSKDVVEQYAKETNKTATTCVKDQIPPQIKEVEKNYQATDRYSGADMFDIANFSIYNRDEIKTIIIDKGNDATHRIWICKLCEEDVFQDLIEECIAKMKNNAEILHTVESLVLMGKSDTVYCRLLEEAITNNIYQSRVIEIYLKNGLDKSICVMFGRMTNDKYKYDILKSIHKERSDLFEILYKNGNCFNNQKYSNEMKIFLEKMNN